MPSLALKLTIDVNKVDKESDDLVSFMSGLLLGSDPQIRSWMSLYIRNGQKKRNENLLQYRRCLADRLTEFISSLSQTGVTLNQKYVVKASAMLRLYAALRGIAGMK
jgi:integrator complex subunit 2